MSDLVRELKRRNVFRVAIAYAVVSWLLVQISATIEPVLLLPDWFTRVVTTLALLGFPIALILSWAYEMTPEGIKKTAEVDTSRSITAATGQKLNYIIIAALLALVVYQQFLRPAADTPAPVGAAGEAHVAIAVLPFSDLTQMSDQAYLGAGIAEEILNVLASIDGLVVTSRTSAFALSDQNLSIPEIADRLGVSHVVEGSIRKQDDRVRITAQLIEVDGDRHLWSDTYDGKLTDIFRLQDDIAGQISGALSARLNVALPSASLQRPNVDVAAYELYLRARELVASRNQDNLRQAAEILRAAVALEPDYADAWAEIGAASALLAYSAYAANDMAYAESSLENGWQAGRRATDIDPDHALGLAVRGLLSLNSGRFVEARILLDRATAQPNAGYNAWLWSGIAYNELGLQGRAIDALERGLRKHPNEPNLTRWLGSVYETLGESDKALQYFEEAAANSLAPIGELNIVAAIRLSRGEIDWPTFLEQTEAASLYTGMDLSVENFDPQTRQLIDQRLDDDFREAAARLRRGQIVLSKYFAPDAFREIVALHVKIFSTAKFHTNRVSVTWYDEAGPIRKTDSFYEALSHLGVVDLWKLYGWPAYCQPDGSERGFSCQ